MTDNPNRILAKILAESIKDSIEWNWFFDLGSKDRKRIDKSEWMIIWLHTDWGGWKTTLIEDLKIELWVKNNKNKTSYFFQSINAWEFNKENKENLWKSIVSFFYLRIVKDNVSFVEKNWLKEKGIELINLLLKIWFSIKWIEMKPLKWFDVKNLFKNKYKEKLNELKDNISLFYSMKGKIKEILKKENVFKKHVLVIDDLDRCSPKEVVNLLDSLKIFMDLPNVIVIVAVDRRHIEKWIYEVYNKNNWEQYLVSPDEYLEKIIHLPIDLFLFDDDIKEWNKDINDKDVKIEKDEEIVNILNENKEIINFWLSNNPRKILRFKRLFKFYYNVFVNLSLQDNERFIIFWLILKLEWWDYFREIIKKPIILNYVENNNTNELIDTLVELFYWINKKEQFLKIKNENSDFMFFDLLNNFEKNKIKNFIKFLKYSKIKRVIAYFYSYQVWKDYINNWDKLDQILNKPLIDLELFNDNFKNQYIKILKEEWVDIDEISIFNDFENELLIRARDWYLENKDVELKNNEIKDELWKFSLVKYIEDNNIKLSKYWLWKDWEMITWLEKYEVAKKDDKKRFLLWTSLFFNMLLLNFDSIYNLNIEKWKNKITFFKDLINFNNIEFYNKLWDKHVLNSLENWEKRTMFWEIVNQISFTKFWPSIWWMVWATDFIQLENIIISNIENADNKETHNLDKWKKIIKNVIILDKNKTENSQLKKYSNMFEFIEWINNEAKNKIKRLKKRLIYIFSHFWSLQDIKNFPAYYWWSREWLIKLWIWLSKYWDLNDAIKNYEEFAKSYKFLVEELSRKWNKLENIKKVNIDNYDNTLNNYFWKYFNNDNIESSHFIENYYYSKIIQDLLYNISSKKDYIKNKKFINIWEVWNCKIPDSKPMPYIVVKRIKWKFIIIWLSSWNMLKDKHEWLKVNFWWNNWFVDINLTEVAKEGLFLKKVWKVDPNILLEVNKILSL